VTLYDRAIAAGLVLEQVGPDDPEARTWWAGPGERIADMAVWWGGRWYAAHDDVEYDSEAAALTAYLDYVAEVALHAAGGLGAGSRARLPVRGGE